MDNVGIFIAGLMITLVVAGACWLVYKGFLEDYKARSAQDQEADDRGAYEKRTATSQDGETIEVESAGSRAGRR